MCIRDRAYEGPAEAKQSKNAAAIFVIFIRFLSDSRLPSLGSAVSVSSEVRVQIAEEKAHDGGTDLISVALRLEAILAT